MMTDYFFVHDHNDVNEDGVTMIKAMETKRTRICWSSWIWSCQACSWGEENHLFTQIHSLFKEEKKHLGDSFFQTHSAHGLDENVSTKTLPRPARSSPNNISSLTLISRHVPRLNICRYIANIIGWVGKYSNFNCPDNFSDAGTRDLV